MMVPRTMPKRCSSSSSTAVNICCRLACVASNSATLASTSRSRLYRSLSDARCWRVSAALFTGPSRSAGRQSAAVAANDSDDWKGNRSPAWKKSSAKSARSGMSAIRVPVERLAPRHPPHDGNSHVEDRPLAAIPQNLCHPERQRPPSGVREAGARPVVLVIASLAATSQKHEMSDREKYLFSICSLTLHVVR